MLLMDPPNTSRRGSSILAATQDVLMCPVLMSCNVPVGRYLGAM